jgi:hypothetical protein
MTMHNLIVPFLTDNPEFARGVEFGMLYARMRQEQTAIADYFLLANQEQILLAANRLGWEVLTLKPNCPGWFWCVMQRRS